MIYSYILRHGLKITHLDSGDLKRKVMKKYVFMKTKFHYFKSKPMFLYFVCNKRNDHNNNNNSVKLLERKYISFSLSLSFSPMIYRIHFDFWKSNKHKIIYLFFNCLYVVDRYLSTSCACVCEVGWESFLNGKKFI